VLLKSISKLSVQVVWAMQLGWLVVVVGSLAVTMSVYCLAAASMYSMALEAVAGST
jgi:hypothetical protein